jgi:hypothetical protein
LAALAISAAAQSSSSQPSQTVNPPASQAPANGGYVATNPLAGVRYDNKYDLSLGMAYDHMKAGPTLLQGSNLGGLDLTGSMWLTKHWGLQTSERAYLGTSGAGINSAGANGGPIKGPFVAQYFFTGGPEWLGPHNQHGAILAHVLMGGAYGQFDRHQNATAGQLDFYYNQFALAGIAGGSFDLNRSAHWVFRVTPDAVMTHYNFSNAPNSGPSFSQFDVNFAISVGLEYKFARKR